MDDANQHYKHKYDAQVFSQGGYVQLLLYALKKSLTGTSSDLS